MSFFPIEQLKLVGMIYQINICISFRQNNATFPWQHAVLWFGVLPDTITAWQWCYLCILCLEMCIVCQDKLTPQHSQKIDNHREYVICCLIMSNSTDKKNHVTVTDDREIRSPVCIQAVLLHVFIKILVVYDTKFKCINTQTRGY